MTTTSALTIICILLVLIAWRQIFALLTMAMVAAACVAVLIGIGVAEAWRAVMGA